VVNQIIIEEILPGAESGVYKLRLSGQGLPADLIISEAYLPPEYRERFLYAGAIVPGEAGEALCFSQFCLAAEKTALRLIARAEQCGAGLSRKLEQRNHSPEAAEAVVSRLTGMSLVNDSRYAELWLKFRIHHGYKSPRFLAAALRAKGVERDTVKEALKSVLSPEVEADLLKRFLHKDRRARTISSRGMLRSMLRAEGFSADTIDSTEDISAWQDR
jgi:regulatory protein